MTDTYRFAGYGLQNNQGYWVGIWTIRATAELVKERSGEKEEIVELYIKESSKENMPGNSNDSRP